MFLLGITSFPLAMKRLWGCHKLTSITIPKSIRFIGYRAFDNCSELKRFCVSEENPNYADIEGVLCNKDKTRLIAYPNAKSSRYSIPSSINSIDSCAFRNCTSLAFVTIPESVTSIGKLAFACCTGLTSVTIPNSISSIASGTFYYCKGLSSINIPNSVTSIGTGVFFNCTCLTSVTIPNSVTAIGRWTFAGCTALKEIIVSKENPNYTDIEGVLFNKNQTRLIA